MKPAAIVATLLLHATVACAVWLIESAPSRTHRSAVAIAILPAASSHAVAATDATTRIAARNPASATPFTRRHALASTKSGAPASTPNTLAFHSGTAGDNDADNAKSGAQSSNQTPVTLPADHVASNRKPDYPQLSRKNDEQGTVVLRVLVSVSGKADKVHLARSSGHALLDESALSAVKEWRFRPATRNSQPIAEWYQLAIPFKLQS